MQRLLVRGLALIELNGVDVLSRLKRLIGAQILRAFSVLAAALTPVYATMR